MSPPPTTTTTTPIFISTTTLTSILTHKTLISHFQSNLPNSTLFLTTPPRHTTTTTTANSALLLMPSFSTHPSLPYIGVKIVTSHSQNSSLNLPSIHACYTLFNSITGQTLALFDATELTLFRTSSISALASSYLSNFNAQVFVMVGAGNLAPHLIKAHLCVRPSISKVFIWNRNVEKAVALAEKLKEEGGFCGVEFEASGFLEEVVKLGDIVSCATNSESELVKGEWLKEGAHLDLVGSFKPSMKECDVEAIKRGRVFVDNDVAIEEAGELVSAFEKGVISKNDVCGNLVDLIKGEKFGRKSETEITMFKSVGSGVVDLLTAQLVYETVARGSG
ncbi:hypothetical protein RND81_14G109400 [Saponaria officinalis]|uniref:Ornithine cyclodeaminase n=1 Tax=Saponaria officinalis TaxID=3572 RepID=A0AAW1GP20_SAPOF